MDGADDRPPKPNGSTKKIRGRRCLLFAVYLKREIAHPLCMGKSRNWLMLLGRDLSCPAVVEIDATEATEIARRGVLPRDDTTVAELALGCRMSKRHMASVLKIMLRGAEAVRRARDESRNLILGSGPCDG